jgi:hypothetical protein
MSPAFRGELQALLARKVSEGSWVEGHGDAALSSNVGSADLAFQRWFRFKEAYSPRLVAEILDGAGLALDPRAVGMPTREPVGNGGGLHRIDGHWHPLLFEL